MAKNLSIKIRMIIVKLIIFLLIMISWFVSPLLPDCAAATPKKPNTVFSESLKSLNPSVGAEWEIYPKSVVVSRSVNRIAYVIHKGNTVSKVIVDSQVGPEFIGILAGTPQFSPDERLVVYGARGADNKWMVVENGKRGKSFDIITPALFSYDSKRLAYIAKNKGRFSVIIDGKEGPSLEGISKTGLPMFSPDSSHLVYVAMEKERMSLMVDQVKSYDADFIAYLTYSPDSKQLASAARNGKSWYLIVNGEVRNETPYEGINYIAFSPDSKRIIYTAKKKDNNYFIIDGKEDGPYEEVGIPVVFSPDSKRLAYMVRRGGESILKIDGKVHERTKGNILNMMFSADSRRFAYTFYQNEKYYVVIDGKISVGYEALGKLLMSDDSRDYAYFAKKGDKFVCVINGKEGPAYDLIGEIVFGGGSRRSAYLAKDGKDWKVVVDGIPGPAYKMVLYPTFSPDSSHLAYIAVKEVRGQKECVLVVDHVEGSNTFQGFVTNAYIIFDTPSALHTIFADSKNQFMRVDVKIE